MNLLEHSSDCMPLIPCQACEIVAWLRSKLADVDFAELVERAKALNPPKRSYRRRSPLSQAQPQQAAPQDGGARA
jgi:hypothetical protein